MISPDLKKALFKTFIRSDAGAAAAATFRPVKFQREARKFLMDSQVGRSLIGVHPAVGCWCEGIGMKAFLALTLTVAFAGSAPAAWSEITAEQVAGKTLVGDKKAKFLIGADGSLTGTTGKGDALSGTWEIKDGNWCRTIKEPARLAGSACQGATIDGNTLTLTNADGSSIAYQIQ